MTLTLDAIRACLEGATPAMIATCARDGTPNVTYLSHAAYVDPEHLALSFQFFSKTRQNVLERPRVRILVWHPGSALMYRVDARFLRTETAGPVFERLRATLAGIASHTGMDGVFRLRGADLYRVTEVVPVPSRASAPFAPRPAVLPRLRAAIERLADATDLEALWHATLDALARHLDVTHAMVLLHDARRDALYAVASHGYDASGVGVEVPLGRGVIGVAARERCPVRVTHLTTDRSYHLAAREALAREGLALTEEIPWPGLAAPGSQVAAPLVAGGALLGVLFAESPIDGRFGYDDEDALATLAAHVAACTVALQRAPEEPAGEAPSAAPPAEGRPAVLRYYREDDSVFLDDAYVIRGVAGALLFAMASDFAQTGRVEFTNRELRLDPRVPLPPLGDNLEARLILLQRRLDERDACVRLRRTARGRLRFEARRPLTLVCVEASGATR